MRTSRLKWRAGARRTGARRGRVARIPVYGTEIPSYRLNYRLTDQPDGKTLLKGTLEQSGVSNGFLMTVPLYADFDGRIVSLGLLAAVGSTTGGEFQTVLPKRPRRVLLNAYEDVLAMEVTANQLP